MNIRTHVLLLAAVLAVPVSAQSVQLRDGSILVGEIQDANGEGFTLLRTDNGGVLQLRWSHLTESSARAHRENFGLLNTKEAEVTVRADVISYESSTGRILELVGRKVKQDADHIYVRRGRDVTPIRRSDLKGMTERQVTPFEIFTKEDYYADLLAEVKPGEDADKHLELGERLMRVRDYDRAEQHMKKAQELGGGRQGTVLAQRMARLQLLKGASEERELLDEIRTYTNRGEFRAAAERIDRFKQQFADSKLQSELRTLENRFTEARSTQLVKDVARLWYKYVHLLANSKADDSKTTLAVAKNYARRGMGKEIREKIAQTLQIQVAEVDDFWSKRFEVRGAVAGQHYHYSVGSWLLGEQGVLKDTTQGKAEAQAAAEKDKTEEEKRIDEGLKRIREAMRRSREARQQQRQGGAGRRDEKKEVTPEEWWKQADKAAQVTWLKAYYAEESGDMKVTAVHVTPCSQCAGSGRTINQGSVGDATQAPCPVCHKTRYKRDVRAR